MFISIDKNSSVPIYMQIEKSIRERILSSELAFGSKLPSERRLAEMLNVHRNTVIKAYKMLADQNFISSEFNGKKGYFIIFNGVTFSCEESPNNIRTQRKAVLNHNTNMGMCETVFEDIYKASFNEKFISFGGHILPDSLINLETIKHVMNLTVDKYGVQTFSYCPAEGNILLRKQLATSLEEDNIRVKAKQVIIINETTRGIEHIIDVLTKKGDYVVAEEPIMPDIYSLFVENGLNVILVSTEKDGVNIGQLESAFKNYKPKFFYVMPDHHGVTGDVTSFERRKEILDLSYEYNVPIVEESWFKEINFNYETIPSLFSIDKHDNVINTDGAITKFYYGSKISYLLAPAETADAINRRLFVTQTNMQNLEQLMFTEYLRGGYHKEQQKDMIMHYKNIFDVFEKSEEAGRLRSLGVMWNKAEGGIGIWCKLPDGINDMHLYKALRKRNVLICPGRIFFPRGTDKGTFVRLSFSNVSLENMLTGIEIICDEIEKLKEEVTENGN